MGVGQRVWGAHGRPSARTGADMDCHGGRQCPLSPTAWGTDLHKAYNA